MAGDYRFSGLRLIQHLGREAVRKVELPNDYLDIHAEIILVSEHLSASAASVLLCTWPAGDLDIDPYIFKIVPFGSASFCPENPVNAAPLLDALVTTFSSRLPIVRNLAARRNNYVLGDLLVHGSNIVVAAAI